MNPTKEHKDTMMRALFIALIVLGILSIWRYHNEFVHALAHAFIIAGILGLTVDYYAKRHLLREAARDIDKYLLGYKLPDELQNKLKEIRNAEVVRRDIRFTYTIESIAGEKKIRLHADLTFEVENFTNVKQAYTAELAMENHLSPKVTLMACITNDKTQQYELRGAALKPKPRGAVVEFAAKTIWLLPKSKFSYINYKFHHEYCQTFPDTGSEYFQFDQPYPTIGATIIVKHPKNFRIDFSSESKSPEPGKTEWTDPKVFLRGEIITMWWRPQDAIVSGSVALDSS
jgi:hypothetical protein